MMLTYNEITKNEAIRTYIIRADESLAALGFTEHSFAHVTHVAETAGYILKTLFTIEVLSAIVVYSFQLVYL